MSFSLGSSALNNKFETLFPLYVHFGALLPVCSSTYATALSEHHDTPPARFCHVRQCDMLPQKLTK